jgi:acyl-CoA thioesterase FadM
VVRRHEVEYLRPARMGDELELTVRVELVRGVRGVRRTRIARVADGQAVAEVLSEWVWVRLSDGRPSRVPAELVEVAAPATAATLARGDASRRRDRALPAPRANEDGSPGRPLTYYP